MEGAPPSRAFVAVLVVETTHSHIQGQRIRSLDEDDIRHMRVDLARLDGRDPGSGRLLPLDERAHERAGVKDGRGRNRDPP